MNSSLFKKISVFIFLVTSWTITSAQVNSNGVINFNDLSETLLRNAKEGKDTQEIQDQLANTNLKVLEKGLQTDHQKLAFWVNIYNAYIQIILSEKPDLYNDRQAFFNDDRIFIAGEKVAFSKIEHGIIRKSQWPLGLGKIRKWFPNKFERKLRVDKRDYRIHFALNCGAKDCPPVAIYEADHLEEQFNKSTELYLKKTTDYNAAKKEVAITSIFSWFRGDFGSKKDVKKILKNQGLIPTIQNIDIRYKNYDWTLYLDNWIEF
ncbi:MAG: DUF547 domain-containing protein [Maribacter sp.]